MITKKLVKFYVTKFHSLINPKLDHIVTYFPMNLLDSIFEELKSLIFVFGKMNKSVVDSILI